MSDRICRWGILGAADIARKNWQAIRNAENCTLVAVASRDLERCRRFIAAVPAAHPLRPSAPRLRQLRGAAGQRRRGCRVPPPADRVRKAWAIRAAEAGKHVLVEKPVGATAGRRAGDSRRLPAQRRPVHGRRDVHAQPAARRASARSSTTATSVGQIKRIASQFTFGGAEEFFQRNIRTHSGLEPLGCLGDLGWYRSASSSG